MRLDDRPRNRQTNAHPLTFRGDEWLEQLLVYLAEIPAPVSATLISPSAVRRRRYDELRCSVSSIDSMALRMRLSRTC
jgi:hypothetical protein